MTARFPAAELAHLVPHRRFGVPEFPLYHVRGGTSTGLVLWARHMPTEPALRDELLRHLMGVPLSGSQPDNRQTHGLGRGTPTSNKVFIVEADSKRPRLTTLLGQLAADKASIAWNANCGNLSAALPLFALDTGLVAPQGDDFEIELLNLNTDTTLSARLRLDQGEFVADTEIAGVAGRFPGVDLVLHQPIGPRTGTLLPTGRPRDCFDGVEASCLDVAVPTVVVAASALGKSGHETPAELDADPDFKARLSALWVAAGRAMGLTHADGTPLSEAELAASETLPKVCMIAPAEHLGHLSVRYFTPQAAHATLAVSGGCALAAACLLPGTVAHEMAGEPAPVEGGETSIALEHPAGVLETRLVAERHGATLSIAEARYRRNAQILLRGTFPLYRASCALADFIAGATP